MDALSKMIVATKNRGFLLGFSMENRNASALNFSPLLFVDNTLIFCEANFDHLYYLSCLFLCFEVVSSLMKKSG
jgi:hypothetical protein